MHFKEIHPWRVSIKEAIKIQEQLKEKIILENKASDIKKIAAVDVGYSGDKAKAVVCVFSFPKLDLVETRVAWGRIIFPYIAGFLSFREGPVILKAFKKIKHIPDLVLFDGQGICHPRKMGIATHLGIILNLPTIGCAKNLLYGKTEDPQEERGSFSYIYDDNNKDVLGFALRTRSRVKPVFVSPGYRIDFKKTKDIVLNLTPRYRIPEPLRFVHRLTKDAAV